MSELKIGELICHIESETLYCKDLKTQVMADKNQFIIICPKCKRATGVNIRFEGGLFNRNAYMICKNCGNRNDME